MRRTGSHPPRNVTPRSRPRELQRSDTRGQDSADGCSDRYAGLIRDPRIAERTRGRPTNPVRPYATRHTGRFRGIGAADWKRSEGLPPVTTRLTAASPASLLVPSLGVSRPDDRVGCQACRSMRQRICKNGGHVKWLSASLRTKSRACRTSRRPIVRSRCWRRVRDQLRLARGWTSRRGRSPSYHTEESGSWSGTVGLRNSPPVLGRRSSSRFAGRRASVR